MMSPVITEQRAVALVEALLAATTDLPPLAVTHVEEHELGWLISWQSATYLRSGRLTDMLVGQGPYLVDREDGSVHHIPVTTVIRDDWPELYRTQIKGHRPPDPLATGVRAALSTDGRIAALRHLRRQAPQLTLTEAQAYLDSVRRGAEPPTELVLKTRVEPTDRPLSIDTVSGPCEPQRATPWCIAW